jgi:hypothetical protein
MQLHGLISTSERHPQAKFPSISAREEAIATAATEPNIIR